MFDSAFNKYLRVLVSRLRSPQRARQATRQRPTRLWVEMLEDRIVPAVYQVTGTADGLGAITPSSTPGVDYNASTLRAAVIAANASVGVADTILVPAGTYTLTLSGAEENAARTGDLDIRDNLTIIGAGSATTTIDATNLGDRVFDVFSGGASTAPTVTTVSLQGLTITGGKTVKIADNLGDYGGALRTDFDTDVTITGCVFSNNSAPHAANNQVYGVGGAIANNAKLTIDDCQFTNNSASNAGGAIYVGGSGAVTTISNTTFTGNMATAGGAIRNHERMTIESSTFSGNQALTSNGSNGQGGAIDNNGGGDLTMVNSTLTKNTSIFGGAIVNYQGLSILNSTLAGNTASYGGGLACPISTSVSSLENTIIATNTASVQGPDVWGSVGSRGHNLIGNTANSSGWSTTDLLNVNPLLGALADNGGLTQTMALLAGSPAIDKANTADAPATDQRGVTRPQGPAADIGAFEVQVNQAPVANNDSYLVSKNNPLTVAAPGVLGNDTDAGGKPLTAILVSPASHGTLTLNADGSFTYTPNTGYTGSDSFTYKANDGQLDSNVATVSLTVHNDAPVAVNDSYTTNAVGIVSQAAPGVLVNDTDANHDPLTAVLVSGPANGSLHLNADGSFTYVPNLGFSGTDTFTYRASDGTDLSNLATVTITVPAAAPGVVFRVDPCDPNGLALVVYGTAGNDRIDIKSAGGGSQTQVTIQSHDFSFNNTYADTFSRIVVYGLAGDDHIAVQNSIKTPALLFGGDGDDFLQAGGGPTVLVGGDGNDHLQGGQGRNVLIGGRGSDFLQGGGGDDILIAGYTDLDDNAAALCAVLDEWSSADSYSVRVASLGSVFNATTVHDDGVVNHLLGGPGTDWFFLDTKRDKLNGARAGEVITDTAGW